MKKYISLLVFSLCAFFFFGFNIKALDFNISFDKNEHFNFFYEMKENTSFYRYLISQGTGLFDTLQDYYSDSTGRTDKPLLLISYLSDVSSTFSSDVVVPDNSYYVISAYYGYKAYGYSPGTGIYSTSTRTTNTYTSLYYEPSDFVFSIKYNATRGDSYEEGDMVILVYYFYDSNSNFLGYYLNPIINGDTSTYSFDYYNFNNFEYLLSSLYYSSDSVFYSSNSSPSLRLNKIIVDGEEYYLKNYETMSVWTQFWKRLGGLFTGVSNADSSDYSLDYFRTNYFISNNKGFPGLVSSLNNSSGYISVSVPDDYSNISFNLDNQYYIVPNSLTCTNEEYTMYFASSSSNEVQLLHYNLLDNDEVSMNSQYYTFSSKFSNFVQPLSLFGIVEVPTDFIYLIRSKTNFYSNTLYYNSSCYSVSNANFSLPLTFTNVNTGNPITLSPATQSIILNNVSESVEQENGVGWFSADNLPQLISNAWSGASSFISAGVEVVSLSTIFFSSLPDEVGGILLAAFSIGILIILIKLIRSLL